MTLKEQYKNADPIGLYTLCNWGGLAILEMNDEQAVAAFDYGDGYDGIKYIIPIQAARTYARTAAATISIKL